ncbi:MAG: DrmE family protein [Oscillospiraceae bacterium]|jgi:hypothetical protein|nr:DrmE family protein [Oscillospiraceae bacterium]
MSTASELMEKVIENCDLLYNGDLFSRELLMRSFAQFLSSSAEKDKHNVGIILHSGSLVFDALILTYAAISNLVMSETSSEDVIDSLEIGSSVLYGQRKRSRYTFSGKTEVPGLQGGEYVLLTQGEGNKSYVPKARWRYITPYNGSSTRLDGRGIRKLSGIKESFFTTVLGVKVCDIPSVIDTSVIVVIPRDRADQLLNGLTVRFGENEARLLDLVTASYYTENDEYYYGGNTAKVEPTLKITGKISVARKLLLDKTGNHNIGLIVAGDSSVSRGESELPELMHRKSVKYVYVSVHIDSEYSLALIKECENPSVFACTREFLLSNTTTQRIHNPLTNELTSQVNAIIDRDSSPVILHGHFSWEQFKDFKRAMFAIKGSEYDSPEKDDFLICAYSLLNLFLTAVFKISVLEEMISNKHLDLVSPADRLESLTSLTTGFPAYLHDKAKYIIDTLETAYLLLTEQSEKETYLWNYMGKNPQGKIAVVVPKAYYASILRETGLYSIVDDETQLYITTANRFDNTQLYDTIISVGDVEGKRFNPFRCRSSCKIITVLYSFESNLFRHKCKEADRIETILNAHAKVGYIEDNKGDDLYYDNATDEEIESVEHMASDVEEYIYHLNEIAEYRSMGYSGAAAGTTAETVAIATFESGERAFFTKMYKAYVFDDNSGEVKELGVEELSEGDSIVFTQNNSETRDIVDMILEKLVSENKLSQDSVKNYTMSKRWKTALRDYMNNTQATASSIAQKMIENGVRVQEITIRGWLDEDSHTVGPKYADSIQQIALLVSDDDMFENYIQYYNACAVIRRIRRDILKKIGDAIINKLCGRIPDSGTLMSEIYDRIDSLALILRLDSISYITRTVPLNATNRPITAKE